MAIRNMHEEARQRNMDEAYKIFRESLTKDVDTRAKNFHLIMVLDEMEETIESQEKKINEYKSFFGTLKSFLPRSFSSTTRIG